MSKNDEGEITRVGGYERNGIRNGIRAYKGMNLLGGMDELLDDVE